MARDRSRLPGLQVPSDLDPGLRGLLEAVKERLELMSGERGDPNARAITVRDSASLISPLSTPATPELDLSLLTRLPFESVQPDYVWLVQGSSIADRYSVSVGDFFEAFTSPYETESISATWTFGNVDLGLRISAIVPRLRMTQLADEDSIDSLDSDTAHWDTVVEDGVYSLRLRDDDDSIDVATYEVTRAGMTPVLTNFLTTGLEHNGSQVITEAGSGLTKTFNQLDPNDFTITLSGDLSGAVSITDLSSAGLASTIVNNAISDTKLRDSVALSVIGRRENSSGDPGDIVAATNNTVLRRAGDALDFGPITSGYIADFAEASRDVVGAMFEDNSEIDFSYDDSLDATDSVDSIGGVTARIVRSIQPIWTGPHRWADNAKVELGSGADLQLYHDGTDSFVKNSTGNLFLVGSGTTLAVPAGLTAEVAIVSTAANVLTMATQNAAFCNFTTYNGSFTSPSTIGSGRVLGGFRWGAHNGTQIVNGGIIRMVTTEAWVDGTNSGTRIDFFTTLTGATGAALRAQLVDVSFRGPDGTAAAPTWGYTGDTDTGERRIGANNIAKVCGAADVQDWSGDTTSSFARFLTQERATGIISPAQLTANTDDWNPTGLANASIIRATTDAARDLTGLQGGASGRRVKIWNVGTQNLVLKHDVTSTAANRFLLKGSADVTLTPNDSVSLWYDSTSSRWRQEQ